MSVVAEVDPIQRIADTDDETEVRRRFASHNARYASILFGITGVEQAKPIDFFKTPRQQLHETKQALQPFVGEHMIDPEDVEGASDPRFWPPAAPSASGSSEGNVVSAQDR